MRRLFFALVALGTAAGCSCDNTSLSSAEGELQVSPVSLDFGAVFLRETKELTIELENSGRSDVPISFAGAPEGYTVEPQELTLAPGAREILTITFAPTHLGDAAGSVELGTASIAVTGLGVERAVEVVDSLDFGSVRVGEAKSLPLEVQNLAGAALLVSWTLTGLDAPAFQISPESLDLGPRGVKSLDVTFAPAARGSHAARLQFQLCQDCPTVEVALRGEGAVEQVDVRPGSVDFGTVTPGLTSTKPVRITNSGDLRTSVVFVEFLDGAGASFAIAPELLAQLPADLDRDAALEIPLHFTPADVGLYEATLVIRVSGSLVQVPIVGRGGSADLIAVPASLDFGVQAPGSPVTRRISVQNIGEVAPVNILDVRVDGANGFRISPDRPTPADASVNPLIIDVTFDAGAVQSYAATLVIVTDDPDEPLLEVPLAGRVISGQPCEITIRPPSVRFGFVHAGDTFSRTVEIKNDGFDDCYVWDFALAAGGSPYFALPDAPVDVTPISPGASLSVAVQYAPPEPNVSGDEGTLTFMRVHPTDPQVSIPLSGFASVADVVVTPNPVDFGLRPIGLGNIRSLNILNQGDRSITVESVLLTAETSPEIGIHDLWDVPRVVAIGRQESLNVTYEAADVGRDVGQLEIWLRGAIAPIIVDLHGEGSNQPCGAACATPAAACPAPQTTWVASEVSVTGGGIDPDGDPVTCSWLLINAPGGSNVQLSDPGSCETRLRPDVPGDYVLELTVTDPQGNRDSCETQVHADTYDGLWIETTWSGPDDLDLHLFHPNAGDILDPATWFVLPWDCYYSNLAPYWDEQGRADDPSLDRDDTTGTGPESVRIDQPSLTHSYKIGVMWFRSSNGHREQDVVTNVYCGGTLAASVNNRLDFMYEAADVGTVTYTAQNVCTFTPGRWTITVAP